MEIFILILAAFITSSISAILGMGGGIILLAIMAIIIPEGSTAIALHGIIQLTSNLTRSFVFRKYIKKNIIFQYFPGALIGLIISSIAIFILIYFFDITSANSIKFDFLKPMIGIFIFWFLFGKRYKSTEQNPHFFKVGLISGLTTVFIGATGPLIAPFFLKGKLNKQNIIANKAVCQAISHLGKIPLFIIFFNFNYFNEIKLLIPLTISVFIGTNLGKHILKFIPEDSFKKLFKVLLTIIASKLIIDQLLIFI